MECPTCHISGQIQITCLACGTEQLVKCPDCGELEIIGQPGCAKKVIQIRREVARLASPYAHRQFGVAIRTTAGMLFLGVLVSLVLSALRPANMRVYLLALIPLYGALVYLGVSVFRVRNRVRRDEEQYFAGHPDEKQLLEAWQEWEAEKTQG